MNGISCIENAIAFIKVAIAISMHETSFAVNAIAFSVFECVCVKILFAFSVSRSSFSVFAIALSMNEISFPVFVNRIPVLAIAIVGFEVMLFLKAIVFLGGESDRLPAGTIVLDVQVRSRIL